MKFRSVSTIDSKMTRRRHELGLTQREVADLVDMPSSTYASWEMGKVGDIREDSLNVLEQLSSLFDITIDELIKDIYESHKKYEDHDRSEGYQYRYEGELQCQETSDKVERTPIPTESSLLVLDGVDYCEAIDRVLDECYKTLTRIEYDDIYYKLVNASCFGTQYPACVIVDRHDTWNLISRLIYGKVPIDTYNDIHDYLIGGSDL